MFYRLKSFFDGKMDSKTENIVFNGSNLSFLEQVDVSSSSFPKLNQDNETAARRLGVDLNALESLDGNGVSAANLDVAAIDGNLPPMSGVSKENATEKLKEKWSGLSLSMSDAVVKVFEASDRPFIIVRDDMVAYANKTMLGILELQSDRDILGMKFLSFVAKEDWNLLAENIGLMLTEEKSVEVRLKTGRDKIYKINLQAMYLDDDMHFTFVLVGDRKLKYNPNAGLYDAVTGLPNFYLFEDRVHIAVKNENYKDVRQRREMIAVVGISIDNFDELQKVNMGDFVLKKLASKLAFRLKKSYTIARGLKYQFWLLLTDLTNEGNLEVEIEKIKAIFDEPVINNDEEYTILSSVGWCVYPQQTQSAKKMIELTIEEIKVAQIDTAKAIELPEF